MCAMSYSEFEVVELTYFRRMKKEVEETLLKRFDVKKANQEAIKVLEKINHYKPKVIETPKEVPPTYLIRVEGKVAIFIIVYPEKYSIYTSDALKVVEYIVDDYIIRKSIEEYVVLIFYSRRGRLGPAAYLYLGTVIETKDVGILFINGDPDEVVEVVEKLKNEGRYEPEEEASVELS